MAPRCTVFTRLRRPSVKFYTCFPTHGAQAQHRHCTNGPQNTHTLLYTRRFFVYMIDFNDNHIAHTHKHTQPKTIYTNFTLFEMYKLQTHTFTCIF